MGMGVKGEMREGKGERKGEACPTNEKSFPRP